MRSVLVHSRFAHSAQHRLALQPLPLKPQQKFDLLFLIPAADDHHELCFQVVRFAFLPLLIFLEGGVEGEVGFLPEVFEVGARGWREVHEALVNLVLDLGQVGQGVDGKEQDAGFFFGEVENFDVDEHVGVHVAAEVAVDELELAVGKFVGEQTAGEADVVVKGPQDGPLPLRVMTVIELVRHKVTGANPAMGFDAIAKGVGHVFTSIRNDLTAEGAEERRGRKCTDY